MAERNLVTKEAIDNFMEKLEIADIVQEFLYSDLAEDVITTVYRELNERLKNYEESSEKEEVKSCVAWVIEMLDSEESFKEKVEISFKTTIGFKTEFSCSNSMTVDNYPEYLEEVCEAVLQRMSRQYVEEIYKDKYSTSNKGIPVEVGSTINKAFNKRMRHSANAVFPEEIANIILSDEFLPLKEDAEVSVEVEQIISIDVIQPSKKRKHKRLSIWTLNIEVEKNPKKHKAKGKHRKNKRKTLKRMKGKNW